MFINLTRSVLAQSATSPATPIEAADQEKIKGIREAVKEDVQRKIAARQTRGYAGTVNSLTETELTLVTKRGEKKVTLKETTQMVNKEKLKEGAYAVVIGLVEGNDVEAKRVVITAAPKIDKRVAVAGRVIDISPEEQLLTVKNEKSGEVVTVEIKEEKQFSQIKADDWLVAIGIPAENDEKMLTAKTVLTKPKI